MFCFSKGKPKTFNPIKIPCKGAGKIEKHGEGRRPVLDKKQAMRSGGETVYIKTNNEKYHSNIFSYTVGAEKTGHPAVFPLKLAQDQVISWTNAGETVLDPFMGSGTTGVACQKLGRNFIGIEIEKNYFEIADKRLDEVKKQGEFLF